MERRQQQQGPCSTKMFKKNKKNFMLCLLSSMLHRACKSVISTPRLRCRILPLACLFYAISKFNQICPNFCVCMYMHFYTSCNPNPTIYLQHKDALYLWFSVPFHAFPTPKISLLLTTKVNQKNTKSCKRSVSTRTGKKASQLGNQATQTTNLPKVNPVAKPHDKNIVIPIKITGF